MTVTWRNRLSVADGDERAEHEERDRVGEQVAEPGVQERRQRDAEQPADRARPDAPAVEGRARAAGR